MMSNYPMNTLIGHVMSVQKLIYPDFEMINKAAIVVSGFITDAFEQILRKIPDFLNANETKSLDIQILRKAIEQVLPEKCALACISQILSKNIKIHLSQLIFTITLLNMFLAKKNSLIPKHLFEFLINEIIKNAGQNTISYKEKRIMPKHVVDAIKLNYLLLGYSLK